MKNLIIGSGVILVIFFINSCKKDKPTPPIITTATVTEISYSTATSGGEVINEGGDPVVSRGICWNSSADPTISNSRTINAGGLGAFVSNLSLLNPNTKYYVKAFATNSAGTGYGNQVSFTTSQVEVPVVTTKEITSITQTNALSGGNISSNGGGSIINKGVCWSITQNPTVTDNKTENGTGIGDFKSSISGLTPGTSYYVRAYATNTVGTAYGEEKIMTTYGTDAVLDNEGNYYNQVIIGKQAWLKENLRVTKYCNGEPVGTTNPANKEILDEKDPKYQWVYDGNENNSASFGRLYTWYAITDIRGVCPVGWHVPDDTEWNQLIDYLGGKDIAGGKLKETGNSNWKYPNAGATNETNFSALPGGERWECCGFENKGLYGCWWSTTQPNGWYNKGASTYVLTYAYLGVINKPYYKGQGYSVRCLKDN
jgi:uncharacterized protein (TIGR02145 family)